MFTKIDFYDFDGTLFDSPVPDPGKTIWGQFHKSPYPHQGWWGRAESLDVNVFTINPREEAYAAYLERSQDPEAAQYILTSRQHKLKSCLETILKIHDIKMHEILCAHGTLTKGERILKVLEKHEANGDQITEITVWEDRNKEIATIEPHRAFLESKGIKLTIYKIESDAKD